MCRTARPRTGRGQVARPNGTYASPRLILRAWRIEAVPEATAKARKIHRNPLPAIAKTIVRAMNSKDPNALIRISVRGRSPRPNAPSHNRNLRIVNEYGSWTGGRPVFRQQFRTIDPRSLLATLGPANGGSRGVSRRGVGDLCLCLRQSPDADM
jgi:hypothetical protein